MDQSSHIPGALAGCAGSCWPLGASTWRQSLGQRPRHPTMEVETRGGIQDDFAGMFQGNSHAEGCSLSCCSGIRPNLGRAPVQGAPPHSSLIAE